MLIATPGQTATYALAAGLSKKTVTTTSNHQSTSTISNTNPSSHNNINNLNSNATQLGHNNKFTFNALKNVMACPNACRDVAHHSSGTAASSSLFMSKDKSCMEATPKQNSSNRTASNLVKSLTVRLNRGTETLKATVQKALLAASAVSGVTNSLIEMSSSNRTATCNNVLTTSKATATAKINTTTSHTILSTLKSTASLSSSSSLQSNAVPNNSNNSNNTISSSSRSNNSSVTALAATNRKYPSAAFLKLYTIPPTIYHRFPNENKQCNRGSGSSSSRNSSTDSLHMEMCHFKPIRTVPVTLWKSGSKSRGCPMRFPTARTEMTLNRNCDVMHKKEANRHSLNMNIVAVNDDVCVNLRPQPSSSAVLLSRVLTTSCRRSAFVCLVARMKPLEENQSTTSTRRSVQSKRKSFGDLHKIRNARRRTKDLVAIPATTRNTRKCKSIASVPLGEDCGGPLKSKYQKFEINKVSGRSTRSSATNILKCSPGRNSTKTSKPLPVTKSKTKTSLRVASKLKKNIGDPLATSTPATLPIPVRKRAKLAQRRKLKSKIVDIVKLAQEMRQSRRAKNISVGSVARDERKTANFESTTTRKSVNNASIPSQKLARKRKLVDEESTANHTSRAAKSRALRYKPSTAMIKNAKSPSPFQATSTPNKTKRGVKPIVANLPINQKKARPSNRLTPPLTRGRLKQLSQNGNFTYDFQQLKT